MAAEGVALFLLAPIRLTSLLFCSPSRTSRLSSSLNQRFVDVLTKRGLWCAFLDWGVSRLPARGRRVQEIRRKMRKTLGCTRAVIGPPKGPTSQTGQGIFTEGCFEIKVPYSPVSLMGSRLNYPSKLLEQNVFGALASNPEGLPVGRRELFRSPWRSVITGSWLSLPRNSQWPGGRGEQVKLYLVGHLLQLSGAVLC